MNMCDDKHQEVCFEGRQCPICQLLEAHAQELKEKDDKIEELKLALEDLENPL